MYAQQLAQALAAAIDTAALAAAWMALFPRPAGGRLPFRHPVVSQFLGRAREALTRAVTSVLRKLWPEGWVLGEKSAQALLAGVETPDWGTWTPGDYEAAEAVAGPGLRQLLDNAGITIKSIVASRLEELSAVLEQTLASDETKRPPLPAPLPPQLSVQSLADQLRDVLDNPSRAHLVAVTEIARAQSEAAMRSYAEGGTEEAEWSTAEDAKVCPACDTAEAAGPVALGAPFPGVGVAAPPGHPRCRCALIPVLARSAA